MKKLQTMLEGILDVDLDITNEVVKNDILKWIEANTSVVKGISISDEPNGDGKYVVNAVHVNIGRMATSLTNGHFVWGTIKHGFVCAYTKITSLEGSPKYVGWTFDCSYTNITTLEGSPEHIVGSFDCSHNKITSLEGSPKDVGGSFICNDTNITSLKGAPKKIGGTFYYMNTEINSSKGMSTHRPRIIK